MCKSAMTWFLDVVRYLLLIAGMVTVLCLSWIRVHWLLAVLLAIPVFVSMLYLVNFLMFPLYLNTREHKVVSRVLKALGDDDFSTALRVLEAYEGRHVVELQNSPRTSTVEVGEAKVAEERNTLTEDQVATFEKDTNELIELTLDNQEFSTSGHSFENSHEFWIYE